MDDKRVILRRMKCDDLDQVVEIEKQCFSTPWSREAFSMEVLQNACAIYIVVEVNAIVVGYGGMWLILDEAHITNIAIHPNYRNKGFGKLILNTMIKNCRTNKINAMTLEVRESNIIAQRLYSSFGFDMKGKRKNYYSNNKEDALIMWKDII